MKILVAGAGHGGLVAGARLAKNGNDVTVIEKCSKDELGHDWEDRFTFDYLLKATEKDLIPDYELPKEYWHYRGDCAFVSPSYNTRVVINYTDETRQKIMWRKPVINMLLEYAEECGVKFKYNTEIKEPIVKNDTVVGVKTDEGEHYSDLVIDAAGVFSPVRSKLPDAFGIEKMPSRADVFYAYRAYYNRTAGYETPETPFEIYLCHEKEQGLSWVCTNDDSVDILIGRIDPLKQDRLEQHIINFKKTHKWIGDNILHAGKYGIIPVRRPLALMVAKGYAAIGDSAFMTTPMNGMGIDLSLKAGEILSKTIVENGNSADISVLWEYNKLFHILYGGDTAKNEGLKNSLLQLTGEGVDFLFDNSIIQAADLSGAGNNTSFSTLMVKFVHGMKKPKYFFAILNGLIKGGKNAKLLKNPPKDYDLVKICEWQKEIESNVVRVTRR